jgi:hypothetical protein
MQTLYLIIILTFSLLWVSGAKAKPLPPGWDQADLSYDCSPHRIILVPDTSGRLHAFWNCDFELEGRRVDDLFYACNTDGEWSSPVDIVTGARYFRALLDKTGIIHIFWSSGGDSLYHAHSIGDDLSSGHSWSAPVGIGKGTTAFGGTVDENGAMHLVFTPSLNRVVYIRSEDEGTAWSSAIPISAEPETGYNFGDVAVDGEGRIHAVWFAKSLSDDAGFKGIFYSRSLDGGVTWSAPSEISTKEDYSQSEPTILAHGKSQVYVLWHGGIGSGHRLLRSSEDGGETWNPPTTFNLPKGGLIGGRSGIAVDSLGKLHMALPTGEGAGLYYVTGEEGNFTKPLRLSKDSIGRHDIGGVDIAITHGNRLYIVYPLLGTGIRSISRHIDAPPKPPIRSLEEVDHKPTVPPPSLTPVPSSTPMPDREIPVTTQASEFTRISLHGLLLGIGLSTLTVIVAIIWHSLRRRHL